MQKCFGINQLRREDVPIDFFKNESKKITRTSLSIQSLSNMSENLLASSLVSGFTHVLICFSFYPKTSRHLSDMLSINSKVSEISILSKHVFSFLLPGKIFTQLPVNNNIYVKSQRFTLLFFPTNKHCLAVFLLSEHNIVHV